MNDTRNLLSLLGPATLATLLFAGDATLAQSPTTNPTTPLSTWDRAFFDYKKTSLVVEETTPTPAQVDWRHRPPQLTKTFATPRAAKSPAKPWTDGRLNILRLRFRDLEGADVPVLLVTPANEKGPFPVAVALHGLRSSKMQVVAQVAPALVKQGFAVLAPDMPLHGERPGDPSGMFDRRDLRGFIARCKQSVLDVRQCIDLAESRPELDTKNGVVLVGYSMGALIHSVVGPTDDRVKAMCLMVGGTVELPEIFAMVPQLAALQPQLAIPHFAGRPLLMMNARQDHIITPEMANRLYTAAPEPKQHVWYDTGHLLPEPAYEEAAQWVARTWKSLVPSPKRD